jgi:hypothetical protein
VIEQLTDSSGRNVGAPVPSCTEVNGAAPCWQLETNASCVGQLLNVVPDPNLPTYSRAIFSYDCAK